MTSFEYLSVLVAVIFGLAISHLISTLGSIIKFRIKLSMVHGIWFVNMFFVILMLWWGLLAWNESKEWNFVIFTFLVVYATNIYLLSDILIPKHMTEETNLSNHFALNSKWFFALFFSLNVLDMTESILKHYLEIRPLPNNFYIMVPIFLMLNFIGYLSRNPRIHVVIGCIWLLSSVLFIFSNILKIYSV